jgi:hypothetical protein
MTVAETASTAMPQTTATTDREETTTTIATAETGTATTESESGTGTGTGTEEAETGEIVIATIATTTCSATRAAIHAAMTGTDEAGIPTTSMAAM